MLHYILEPVKKLVKGAEALEKGDFKNAKVNYQSKDEFGQLSVKLTRAFLKSLGFYTISTKWQ